MAPKRKSANLTELNHFLAAAQVWMWDLQNPDDKWESPLFWSALGYDPSEVSDLKAKWRQIVFETDAVSALETLQLMQGNPEIKFENIIRARNSQGEITWLKCKGNLLNDAQGTPLALAVTFVDISAEKSAEHRLQQEAAISRCIRDSNTHYVAKIDLEGYFTFINDAYAQFLGFPVAKLVGRQSGKSFIDKDQGTRLSAFQHCALNPERPYIVILQANKNPNAIHVQEWIYYGLKGAKGAVSEILCVGRDTGQLNVEQQVAMERSRPAIVSGLMIWTISFDGTLNSVSPSWEFNLGQRYEDVVGSSFEKFVHAEDLGRTIQAVGRAIRDHVSQVEHRLVNGQGTWIWAVTEIKKNELTSELHLNSYDITDKKITNDQLVRTSQMLEQTSEIARVGGWEYDILTKKLYFSKITREIHEEEPEGEISLSSALQMYASDAERQKLSSAAALAQTGTPWDIESLIRTRKGNMRWVRSIGRAQMENGVCVRMYGTVQDITDRKKNEQKIEKARLMAESASKAKSDFLANMSHEIRTPLNGILGLAELLDSTDLNEVQQNYTKMLTSSSHLLLNIVNDILDFSKIEAQPVLIVEQQTDLVQLSRQCMDVIAAKAQNKGLEIVLEMPDPIPASIWVDATRLQQILVNVLGNAVKFTTNGKILLLIQVANPTSNPVSVRFSVIDTGIGIAAKNRKTIFDAFVQEDLSATKRYEGTGLGLTISNKLLAAMGSKLEVQSRVGQGSKFSFVLKLKTEQKPEMTERPVVGQVPVAHPSDNHAGERKSHKILIVEDNKVNMLVTRKIISGLYANCVLLEATNGIEGLNQFETHSPDLILMDIQMPEMNGYDCARAIRTVEEQGKHVTIVAITANATDGEADNCFNAGMDGFIAKPLFKKDLENELARLMFDQKRNLA
jgi:PAS domain S-box-containing protein